jgi:fructokinase
MNESKKDAPGVICFGEMLWDNLPSGRKPGGAPMNVAYHLNKFHIRSTVLSRVGNDADGIALLNVLKDLDLGTDCCQVDFANKTSTVEVQITENNEVEYEIVSPVAWDFIALQTRYTDITRQADAFVFGSLSGRNEVTRATLSALLELASYRVFDVNLRAPHYDRKYIQDLLQKTNLLKLNEQELKMIAGWSGRFEMDEKGQVKLLQDQFNIPEIIVTKGAAGASFYNNNLVYDQRAFKIKVKDTVGSGDSFLAAFLSRRLKSADIQECLRFASAVSAFITSQSGACPPYQMADLTHFISTASENI